jgi:glycosyltransferase involved in cell wall biosynthesis
MTPISCVIIARNEEKSIVRTLDSVAWCSEVVVVDSGSTDHTVEICRQKGVQVYTQAFLGYGKQKQWATSKAHYDWILNIDADEVVSAELTKEVKSIFEKEPNPQDVFFLPIPLYFMGRCLQNSRKKGNIRLFNRLHSNFSDDAVHEKVLHEGKVHYLKNPVKHFSYENIEDYLEKFNRYTTAAASDLHSRQKHICPFFAFLRFPLTFLHFYFLKGFFIKGWPGLVWSFLSSLYPTVKGLKLFEIYENTRSDVSPDQQ